MPRITLKPIAVALAADIRRTVHGQVDVPAPGELQFNALELREHPFEKRPGRRRNVLGHATQIGAAAAEQQAVVRGAAEVVEDELVIGHAHVARQRAVACSGVSGAVAT
jgi:hypothetical protein